MDAMDRPVWHACTLDEVIARTESAEGGLHADEAARRLEVHGPNELEAEPPTPALVTFLHQITDPLIVVLLVAAVVSAVRADWTDTIVIGAVVGLNAIIGFTQERRAERSVRSLQHLVSPVARVLRDGHELEVPSREVVPGDVVLLESGMRVPADVRLAHTNALAIDESLLTGESVPVDKRVEVAEADTLLAERHGMAWAGSVVTTGRGRGHVVSTGTATEIGAVAGSIASGESPTTPLQKRMGRLAALIGVTVAISAITAFVLGIVVGEDPGEMFSFAVALAVMAIPEGLPVVLTITLALGVRRMARRNALIRQLPAVETLGSTTVIGTDKTGTLTENRMTVEALWDGETVWDPSDEATSAAAADPTSPLGQLLRAGVLANEAEAYTADGRLHTAGDPTEAALLVVADRVGAGPEQVRQDHAVTAEVPFEPERGWSAAVTVFAGEPVLHLKGAPEKVVAMCSRTPTGDALDPEVALGMAQQMAADGLRVLALAARPLGVDHDPSCAPDTPDGLTLLGLAAMLDPPRAGVADAIADCHRAGIRTVMITGDHAVTAGAIAERLGIVPPGCGNDDDRVLTGREIERLDDEELVEAVATVAVVSRAAPDHKLRVVQAMQRRGEVVAVTGDGVNDAPALNAADIGVAMGRDGTDVARDAADMVLADDNYVTIAGAVEEGRAAFDNVRKVTFFLLSTGVAGIVALLGALTLGWPLLLVPAQILWLNLVTKGLQDVALAFEPPEPGLLDRPPRKVAEGVMNLLLWERTALVAVVMGAGTLWQFQWVLDDTGSLELARTAALTTLVLFQAYFLITVRSELRPAWATPPTTNPFLFFAAVGGLAVHAVALYLPPTQLVLEVEPLGVEVWLRSAVLAAVIVLAVEIHKAVRRRWPLAGRWATPPLPAVDAPSIQAATPSGTGTGIGTGTDDDASGGQRSSSAV
jgi:calcium-translocating P-type ATPase